MNDHSSPLLRSYYFPLLWTLRNRKSWSLLSSINQLKPTAKTGSPHRKGVLRLYMRGHAIDWRRLCLIILRYEHSWLLRPLGLKEGWASRCDHKHAQISSSIWKMTLYHILRFHKWLLLVLKASSCHSKIIDDRRRVYYHLIIGRMLWCYLNWLVYLGFCNRFLFPRTMRDPSL